MCGFCSRDISSVKANKSASAPQSKRRFDYSDGLYFGGFLNGTPSQYIMFSGGGIKIFSPTGIELEAPKTTIKSPTVQIEGNTTQNGSFSQTGGGAASFSGSLTTDGQIESKVDVVGGGKSLVNHTNGGSPVD